MVSYHWAHMTLFTAGNEVTLPHGFKIMKNCQNIICSILGGCPACNCV